ncbi:simple sugar transport system ATP-binding protein [Enterococcus rivorum]|uniref:Heme ABC transporter ATP-binding protein n=1 Tax=Enterococcus rivorum TaxID=762845 RepID=A0A1E5KZ80_9ENTE|nr:ABC transporter ATP-binding protein [Enterococcus rivorum]MBP2097617.1 simple sugar transport system ATP-binding protein [Enterococcus rivorum]OEH83148.1 heme ABC transporter ATP-binding protein [Enterococcus rivorum]
MNKQPISIEMIDIVKQFGEFRANDGINLKVERGEIHALLGENGAGKSTLMNILSGLLEPTSGTIKINGEKVTIANPTIANNLGIGMVHQHFMLIQDFTVSENIILGSEPMQAIGINKKEATKTITELSKKYGLDVKVDAKVVDITIGMQQRVEILKTLYRGADILIFDEPTAVLTPQEIDELIVIMKTLTKEGKSIILITHKLDEIKAVADHCTVIRRGKSIDTVAVADVSQQELADMMVGRAVSFKTDKKAAEPKEVILEVNELYVKENRGLDAVKNLSLTVRAGEVVGIAGIDGNGQSELIQALTGLTKIEKGSIKLNGEEISNKKPRQITESKVGHVPEDRHKYGLILPLSVAENIGLQTYYKKPLSKHGFLNYEIINQHARELIEEFDVRTVDELVPVKSLSGGNQQKAIIAREIDRNPDLLIVAQPTRGLDVGAIEYIHKRLIDQRDCGKAVLLISFELDEILNVSDRIAVMHDGQIAGVVKPEETTQQELGLLMAGATMESIMANRVLQMEEEKQKQKAAVSVGGE